MDTSSLDAPALPGTRVPRGPSPLLRRLGRALRHAPDRLLHAARRRELQERLREWGLPRSILFVCFGNICRSPYAAVRLALALPEELRERIHIASAGFIGAGRPSPAEAVEVAASRGADLSAHRSNPLTQEAVRSADLVVVMDTIQHRWICEGFGRNGQTVVLLGDFDPQSIDTRAIRDPIEQPTEVFQDVYSRIDRCIEALAETLSNAEVGMRNAG